MASFDNLDHELMMKAIKFHTDEKWIHLYTGRWLKASLQREDGELIKREKGTPMSLRYNKLKNHPTTFKRLFGLLVDEFERILKAVEPQWEKRVVQCYKRPGRNNKLSLRKDI